jgi:hypothetical protein
LGDKKPVPVWTETAVIAFAYGLVEDCGQWSRMSCHFNPRDFNRFAAKPESGFAAIRAKTGG